MNAAEIARIIVEANPDDPEGFIAARFGDVPARAIRHALALAAEVIRQDQTEAETRQRQVFDVFEQFVAALKTLDPPIGMDESIGDALARCPAGHRARALSLRIWKCAECGGLGPLMKLVWAVSDDETALACPYCGDLDSIGMWKEPVS